MTDRTADQRRPFTLPDSALASAAIEFVYGLAPEFVAHHSVRSYLFAREIAAAKGLRADIDYDDELVFLSCVLHDLGATDHGNGDQRFEVDGADAAAEFLREHGVSEPRITTVWRAIALHTSAGLAHRFGVVQAVTHLGIGTDIIGVERQLLSPGFADRVHEVYPRHNLGYALSEIVARQVQDNPTKGPPMTFPSQVHHLMYPALPQPTWFDLIEHAGWNDQPVDKQQDLNSAS
ncbi:MAG: HD domain-containing protein [Mycobacterium sp.]